MLNKIEVTWTRADVEVVAGRPLTDKEWEVLASELQDAIEETIIPKFIRDTMPDLGYLVSQDAKYDEEVK